MDFNLLCTLLFVVLLLAVGSINCGSDDDQSVISTNESGTAGERIDPGKHYLKFTNLCMH